MPLSNESTRLLTVATIVLLAVAFWTDSHGVAGEPLADRGNVAVVTWPQWRGPTRDGRVQGPRWPTGLTAERLTPLWKVTKLGPSYAGPIVTEDRVFSVETRDKKVEIVRAYDRKTGTELWEAQWEGAMKVPFFAARNGSWVRSTPAADGERLYVAGMRDHLVCLSAKSGEILWNLDFVKQFDAPLPAFGFVCSPLVISDHLFVQAGGAFTKLDKKTGDVVWRTLEGGGGIDSTFSSPVLETIHGQEQLLVLTRHELCGVTPESGDVLWRQPITAFRGMNILTPIVHGDAVFTATYGGTAQLLDIAREENAYQVDSKWETPVQGYMTSPVIVDGNVYFFSRSKRFVCLGLDDGEKKWVSPPTGDDYWSLVVQNDRILALSNTGKLRLVRATPEAYEVLGEVTVAEDKTWAHLAVAGNEIFIREEHGLAAYRWE